MRIDKEPEFALEDRLINLTEDEAMGAEDEIPYEKVVKNRFWDIDDREFWYAIGLKSVNESYDMYDESYLKEHYRKVTDE